MITPNQAPQDFIDLTPSQLIEKSLQRKEGTLTDTGALLVVRKAWTLAEMDRHPSPQVGQAERRSPVTAVNGSQ